MFTAALQLNVFVHIEVVCGKQRFFVKFYVALIHLMTQNCDICSHFSYYTTSNGTRLRSVSSPQFSIKCNKTSKIVLILHAASITPPFILKLKFYLDSENVY